MISGTVQWFLALNVVQITRNIFISLNTGLRGNFASFMFCGTNQHTLQRISSGVERLWVIFLKKIHFL